MTSERSRPARRLEQLALRSLAQSDLWRVEWTILGGAFVSALALIAYWAAPAPLALATSALGGVLVVRVTFVLVKQEREIALVSKKLLAKLRKASDREGEGHGLAGDR